MPTSLNTHLEAAGAKPGDRYDVRGATLSARGRKQEPPPLPPRYVFFILAVALHDMTVRIVCHQPLWSQVRRGPNDIVKLES